MPLVNRFKLNVLKGLADLDDDSGSHVIKVALLANTYTYDADHNIWGDVSAHEVSGSGYTTGGEELQNKSTSQDDSNDRAVFDADDVSWPSSTITARYAVIYDDTLINKDLIAIIDFGQDKSSSGSTFGIQWSSSGILYM